MVFFNIFYNKRFYHYFLTVIITPILLLNGCKNQLDADNYNVNSSSSYYLEKAEKYQGAKRIDYQLFAIRALLHENQVNRADSLWQQLPKTLTPAQLSESFLLSAEITVALAQPSKARVALSKVTPDQLSAPQQFRFYRAQLAATDERDVIGQLRNYVYLIELADPEQRLPITDQSFALLSSLSIFQLSQLTIQANETVLQGWLDLAHDYSENQQDPTALTMMLKRWQMRYPTNPYNTVIPTALTALFDNHSVSSHGAQHDIALLLPLTGAGSALSKAILAGFTTGMQQSGADPNQIKIYDTTQEPIRLLLQHIAQTTPNAAVVGPLLKADVDQLAAQSSGLAILALNNPTFTAQAPNVCYFALDPEDEARGAAEYIAAQNHSAPLILAPNTAVGQRMARAFEAQWLQQHRNGVLVQYFTPGNALQESLANNQGLSISGTAISLTSPPALSDIDALFIIAEPNELSFIKSMIDMNATTPIKNEMIYTTSRSHSAKNSIDYRLEMDGIHFSDVPFLMTNTLAYRNALSLLNNDYALIRLYAFGLDAWQLIQSGTHGLTLHENMLGQSGALTLGENCTIHRKLPWLTYQQGKTVASQ